MTLPGGIAKQDRVRGGPPCTRVTATVVALVLGVACGQGSGPIYIGLALPLTDSAVAPMRRGAALALEEINAAGGVEGRRLALIERDDRGDADSAMRVASELYESRAVAVIGSIYSGLTLAAAPIYNGGTHPLVQLAPSASSPDLTDAGDYTFRLCSSDLAYGAALARWAYQRLGRRRAAVLYVNDEYGRGVRSTFTAEFGRLGGTVVEVSPFLAERPNVGPYLARMTEAKRADVLLLAANIAEGERVLVQVRAARLTLPVLGGDGFVGIEDRGSLAEGMFISTGYLADETSPANQRFVEAYHKRYPEAIPPDQGAAATYDAVRLLGQVIARAGPDRRRVRDALAEVGRTAPPYEGVVGTIAFDRNGDVPQLAVQIGVVHDGRLVSAEAR